MDFIDEKIKETEDWLKANENQATLPMMTIEDELLKQQIKHKKEILDLCHQFRHHPLRKSFAKQESFGDDPYRELFLKAIENGALNQK
jgi:hypothetical protein